MVKELKKLDDRDLLLAHLKRYGIKQSWLAKQIGISDSHLTLIFQKERILTDENLEKSIQALGTDFRHLA